MAPATGTLAAPAPAAITLSPACGSAGTALQVNGSGWVSGPNAFDITITFDGSPGSTVKAADIKADGTFASGFSVPSRPQQGSPYAVTASQTQGEFSQATATANFFIPCVSITINPTCGSVGDPIAVHGAGFRPDVQVAISFTPPVGTPPLATPIAKQDSTFDVTVAVPSDPPGVYTVTAVQQRTPVTPTAMFQIPCAKAAIVLMPKVGPPGTVVTVTGTGFPVGAVVKLSWSQGIPISTASIVIDATQGFKVTLLIFPHDELGQRHLNAGPDLSVANPLLFNIATADFLVVPGTEQPRDFSWRH